MSECDVRLCCYDLSQGMARAMSRMMLGEQLEGIWHTSIVVFGKEFYFNGGVGIEVAAVPGSTHFGTPLASEPIGRTSKTLEEFLHWVSLQRRTGFGPMDYHLIYRNCNHFSQEAAKFLVGVDIPADIREMIPRIMSTPLGRMLGPMISQTVGATGNESLGSAVPVSSSGVPLGLPIPTPSSLSGCGNGFRGGKRCLSDDDEEDLILSKLMFESCELDAVPSDEAPSASKLEAVKTLETVIQNILQNPFNEQCRSLSMSSSPFNSKLLPFEEFGVDNFLKLSGFRIRQEASGVGQRWILMDMDASQSILERMREELRELITKFEAKVETETCTLVRGVEPVGEEVFSYCVPPFSGDFTPLNLDPRCSPTSLFSILKLRKGDENHCFGKCRFSSDMAHLEAWVLTKCALEERIAAGSYAVLCVRKGCESRAIWVPSSLALSDRPFHFGVGAAPFIFHPTVHCGVIRAFLGGETHPGVMESSGRCLIPFGGVAVDVTADVQVLCDAARLPPEIRLATEQLYEGEALLSRCLELAGHPIKSFDELCECHLVDPTTSASSYIYPLQARRREDTTENQRPKLLVCHDMRGGYQPGDYAFFCSTKESKAVNEAYTPEYWHLLDYFVYFSHHRVSIPPREWISAGHKNGVPVLGTVMFEGGSGSGDLSFLLTNPQRTARVLTRLVEVCDYYRFDGYFINCEVATSSKLAKRFLAFCDILRTSLRMGEGCGHRVVIWYDGMTSTGDLEYQNALTPKNESFFNVSDALLTNYFWNTTHLHFSRTVATRFQRARDCFVGVDVFGRNMRFGGKYESGRAVAEATDAGLSVGLFAPAWTVEEEGRGSRAAYLKAESRLWTSIQVPFLHHPPLELDGFPYYTCFTSAADNAFYAHGSPVALRSPWCQLSAAHRLPPLQYDEAKEDGLRIRLPLGALSDAENAQEDILPNTTEAQWVSPDGSDTCVWFGNRSIDVDVPPQHHVQLLRWRCGPAPLCSRAAAYVAVDVVLRVQECLGGLPASLRAAVRLEGTDASAPHWVVLEEKLLVRRRGVWAVARFFTTNEKHGRVTAVSLANWTADSTVLHCRVGGVAVVLVQPEREAAEGVASPLCGGGAKAWPNVALHHTLHRTEDVIVLPNASEVLRENLVTTDAAVALVAEVSALNGTDHRFIFLGQHHFSRSSLTQPDELVVRVSLEKEFRLLMVKYIPISHGF